MSRRGMAIPIVMGFIALLSITAVMLLKVNKQDLPRSFVNLKHLQMKYLAKGALQHARVKMKLLSTQAYDAAAYSVGKNPFFDHSAGYAHLVEGNGTLGPFSRSSSDVVTNPGPAFFTGTVDASSDPIVRENVTDVYDSGLESWGSGGLPNGYLPEDIPLFRHEPNPDSGEMPALRRVNLALVRFWEDISTLDHTSATVDPIYANSNRGIQIDRDSVDPVTGVQDRFDASYRVSDMRVLAGRGNRLYGEEAVKVQVLIQMRRRSMIAQASPTTTSTGSGFTQSVGSASLGGDVEGELRENAVFKVARTLD